MSDVDIRTEEKMLAGRQLRALGLFGLAWSESAHCDRESEVAQTCQVGLQRPSNSEPQATFL